MSLYTILLIVGVMLAIALLPMVLKAVVWTVQLVAGVVVVIVLFIGAVLWQSFEIIIKTYKKLAGGK